MSNTRDGYSELYILDSCLSAIIDSHTEVAEFLVIRLCGNFVYRRFGHSNIDLLIGKKNEALSFAQLSSWKHYVLPRIYVNKDEDKHKKIIRYALSELSPRLLVWQESDEAPQLFDLPSHELGFSMNNQSYSIVQRLPFAEDAKKHHEHNLARLLRDIGEPKASQ